MSRFLRWIVPDAIGPSIHELAADRWRVIHWRATLYRTTGRWLAWP